MDLTRLTIKEAHQGLVKKEFSALELCKAYLDKIKKKDRELFAFLTVNEDLALSQAKRIDNLISGGKEISPIAGIPAAIKDNILVENIRCTAGSKILENFIAPYDATVIKKLKNAGVVFVGKTNMDEFAMGSSTETSYFGPTRNPFDLERVPGGSSGGSTAAVASQMCLGALGSDTGGSIRQPASFCGVVGFKPTYGSVSRYGLIAMASSLDQIGPITKTVEDAKMLFNSIKGEDRFDSTSVKVSNRKIKEIKNLKTMKIGFIDTQPTDKSQKIYNKTIEKLKKYFKKVEITSQLKDVLDLALACYYIIMFAEVSSNLARYDGIKYGYSKLKTKNEKLKTKNLLEVYLQSRAEGFGAEAKRRIMLGTYVLSAGYYEAYYKSAQKARAKIRKAFEEVFKQYDLLILPTSPTLPFKVGEKINDPLVMYLSDIYTVSANIAGLPAISVPIGKVDNLPVGLQIVGPAWSEDKLFDLAKVIETIR